MRKIKASLGITVSAAFSLLVSLTSPVAAEEPTTGGQLVMGNIQSPRHLNGAVQSGLATGLPSTQIFASLLRYDDSWNPQPYLATSWEWSDDGLALTLKLRENAVFHDGEPITSEDVAFSIMQIKEHHPFQTMFGAVESVESSDPHTAIIHLSKPHPALLIALSPPLAPIIPKHIYGDGQDLKSHPRNIKDVVGSGPFKLKSFTPGTEVVLERFDDYFLEGQPYLDGIVMQINPDETTLMLGLERGDMHVLPFMSEQSILSRAQQNDSITVLAKGYEGIGPLFWLAINTKKEPLNDVRVRQAIAYTLDKDFIVKALTAGFAKRADGPIIGSSPYATPDVVQYEQNLEKAKALLDEAGLPAGSNGERFSITVDHMHGSLFAKTSAEYIRAQLRNVGINAQLRTSADFPSWTERIANFDFDMTTDTVWNWGDPVIGVHRTFLSSNIKPVVWTNTQSYSNERVDELLEQAATELDLEKRKELYAEFQKIVTTEVPIIQLVETPYHTLVSNRIGGAPDTIWGPLSPMDGVYLK